MAASFKRGSRLCRILPPLRGLAPLSGWPSCRALGADGRAFRSVQQCQGGTTAFSGAPEGQRTAVPLEASFTATLLLALVISLPTAGVLGWWYRRWPQPLPMPPALQAAGVFAHASLRRQHQGVAGAGLVVNSPVGAGSVLLRVPRSAVLSGAMAQRVLGCNDVPTDVALLALLAEARRAAEKGEDLLGLREYLLSIPADFPMVPLTFSEEDVDIHLRGSSLLLALAAQNGQLEEEQKVALEHLPQLTAPWSIDRLRWAKAAVLTRAGPCFSASTAEEAEAMQGIVPLVDFANCSADPTARCRVGTDDSIELVAVRDLQAGEAVTISYGQQSQEQQIFNFGFALDSSSMDLLTPLAMVVPPEVTTAVELRSVLLKFLFLERGAQADTLGGDLPPVALLRARSLEEIDVSEMRAVANLLEMPEGELRSVADHVKSQQVRVVAQASCLSGVRRRPAVSMLDMITILSAAGLQQELGNAFDGRSLVINEQENGSSLGDAAEQVSDTLEAIDNTLASGLTAATGSMETAAEHLSNIFDGVETILGGAASALIGGSCSSESSEPAPSKSVD
ncbi:SETD3 [Symbiodinium sp. CCMP2592]|nr:SETD3 [Symbiodinium sp. CCMP2592]